MNTLADCSDKWLLKFSVSKCKLMHIGTSPSNEYTLCNSDGISSILPLVTAEKHLGVWIMPTMNFTLQCQKVAAKANQALDTIKRVFK